MSDEKRENENEIPRPQPGKQTEFFTSTADIAIFGGAAQGGKSVTLLLDATKNIHRAGYSAVIFRQTYTQLDGPGGLWNTAEEFYPKLGRNFEVLGKPRFRYTFPLSNGKSTIEFKQLRDKAEENTQGWQFTYAGFDELCQVKEDDFWWVVSRLRSANDIPKRVRATCNPDPNSWVREFLDWWIDPDTGLAIPERSGVVRYFFRLNDVPFWGDSAREVYDKVVAESPDVFKNISVSPKHLIKSVTFIPAKITDNKLLLDNDPESVGNLMALPEKKRRIMLEGNWNVYDEEGAYFSRDNLITLRSREDVPERFDRLVRVWDLAETAAGKGTKDPDFTVGLLAGYVKDTGRLYVLDVTRMKGAPQDVERHVMLTTAQDADRYGRVETHIEQIPGGGKTIIDHYTRVLAGYSVQGQYSNKAKETRATPVSIAVGKKQVFLVHGEWIEPFIKELVSFGVTGNKKDDQVDCLAWAYNICVGTKSSGISFARIGAL